MWVFECDYCMTSYLCFGVNKHNPFPIFMLPDIGKQGDKRFEYFNVSVQIGIQEILNKKKNKAWLYM